MAGRTEMEKPIRVDRDRVRAAAMVGVAKSGAESLISGDPNNPDIANQRNEVAVAIMNQMSIGKNANEAVQLVSQELDRQSETSDKP